VIAERGQEGIERVRELTQGGSQVVIEAVGHLPAYGVVRPDLLNEDIVGEALEPFMGEVVIATKFGFKNGSPAELDRQSPGDNPQNGGRITQAPAHRYDRSPLPASRGSDRSH
jgi:hypothetical protein